MRQIAKVIDVPQKGNTIVEVNRKNDCSGQCHTCAGCKSRTMHTQVKNDVNAKIGDWVVIEIPDRVVLKGAALVYLLPFFLFFAGYLVFSNISHTIGLLAGGVGFIIAVTLAIVVGQHKNVSSAIVAIIQGDEKCLDISDHVKAN